MRGQRPKSSSRHNVRHYAEWDCGRWLRPNSLACAGLSSLRAHFWHGRRRPKICVAQQDNLRRISWNNRMPRPLPSGLQAQDLPCFSDPTKVSLPRKGLAMPLMARADWPSPGKSPTLRADWLSSRIGWGTFAICRKPAGWRLVSRMRWPSVVAYGSEQATNIRTLSRATNR